METTKAARTHREKGCTLGWALHALMLFPFKAVVNLHCGALKLNETFGLCLWQSQGSEETQIQEERYLSFHILRIKHHREKGTTGISKPDIPWNFSRHLQILKLCQTRSQEIKQKSTVSSKKIKRSLQLTLVSRRQRLEFKAHQG